MSIITTLFPQISFTTDELIEVQGKLSHPLVKQYFLHCGAIEIHNLSTGGPAPNEPHADYLYKQARVQGGLDVLDKLLQFEFPIQIGDKEE